MVSQSATTRSGITWTPSLKFSFCLCLLTSIEEFSIQHYSFVLYVYLFVMVCHKFVLEDRMQLPLFFMLPCSGISVVSLSISLSLHASIYILFGLLYFGFPCIPGLLFLSFFFPLNFLFSSLLFCSVTALY